ncbi:hypothetical protein LTR62_003289 [Meristemomyces frigidus]|uniref:Mitochondrial outer membrane transport complex Sam37/metaxin N-terminal domain-containing protein n=1 Tax=Meristemomyces frigidus TaxID=1508187 RepID=A0AAN7TLE0_9PEZI|nr:hypothetical protein LTR62_003289 [Meristemomyces frigidus]
MRLYVLGPAFDLPSLDPECLAAIALLQSLGPEEWQLIPTHDDTHGLPYLTLNNDNNTAKSIHGFASITHHLRPHLPKFGDDIALTSFLHSTAQPLLDLSLYLSSENYPTTRSAFTKILPWHTNYLLPPRRRAAARHRTENLGLGGIDVDNVHEDLSGRPEGFDGVGKEQGAGFEVEAQKRASLLLPRKDTLKSFLKRPEHSAVFKLHSLAENFFGPLQDILESTEGKYLHGDKVSAVDCLAYGYLALMLFPTLPQDWLARTMKRKYGVLVAYVERIHAELRLGTNVGDVMALSQCRDEEEGVAAHRSARAMTLPWSTATTSTPIEVLMSTARELLSHIPFLSPSTTILAKGKDRIALWQQFLPALLTLATTAMGTAVYLSIRTGLIPWPHGETVHLFGRKRLVDYGHLGAALGGLSLLGR